MILLDKEIQANFEPLSHSERLASSGIHDLEESKDDRFENSQLIEKVQMLTENVEQKDILLEQLMGQISSLQLEVAQLKSDS